MTLWIREKKHQKYMDKCKKVWEKRKENTFMEEVKKQ